MHILLEATQNDATAFHFQQCDRCLEILTSYKYNTNLSA